MSSYVVRLEPRAERDIADAFLWYRERNPMAAESFRAEVFDLIDRIADVPLSWPVIDEDGNRRRSLRRFPYAVIFEVRQDTITVMAIAHHRRKPGYWQASPGR